MRASSSGSPIEYPRVTIGTEVLTVKIGLLAENIISRAGLSLDQAISPLRSGNKDPRNLDHLFQLFSAAVAHNYTEQGLMVPTPNDWIAKVEAIGGDPDSNAPILSAMRSALVDAVVKRWPALKQVPVPEPPAKNEEPKADPQPN